MIPLSTSDEIRRIDRRVIEEIGIASPILMERAGVRTAEIAASILEESGGASAAVFCGRGNNGGDGFVVARELANHGYSVRIFLFGDPGQLRGDARSNYELAKNLNIPVSAILEEKDVRKCAVNVDLVIDALLGTGASGPLWGTVKKAAQIINRMVCPVLAVDIPTGVNADTGECSPDCIRADITVTMGVMKRGLCLYPGKTAAGHIVTADIGFPPAAVEAEGISVFLPDDFDIWTMLPVRLPTVNKTQVGKVLLLAGSVGMTGAAALAAEGAVRAGAGLVVVGIPESLNGILEMKLTEAMTLPLPETSAHSLAEKAAGAIRKQLAWASAAALGPGLSRNPETVALIRKICREIRIPMALDADALYALSPQEENFPRLHRRCVITPHEGELARLMGWQAEDIRRDRISAGQKAADALGVTVLLKGAATVVASPSGAVWINPTGNAGLASGGAGDVLTGIIAAFLGQGMNPDCAALAGAYLHGRAADIIAEQKGALSLAAGDIPVAFGEALQSVIPPPE